MTEWATLIAAFASLIAALTGGLSCMVSLRNSRKIGEVHELTNSRMTQLVDEVRASATNKATLDERAAVKAAAENP